MTGSPPEHLQLSIKFGAGQRLFQQSLLELLVPVRELLHGEVSGGQEVTCGHCGFLGCEAKLVCSSRGDDAVDQFLVVEVQLVNCELQKLSPVAGRLWTLGDVIGGLRKIFQAGVQSLDVAQYQALSKKEI